MEICESLICYYFTWAMQLLHQNGKHLLFFSMSMSMIWCFSPVVEPKAVIGQLPLLVFLDPVATSCLVFLAAEVGGGCRTWKETWAACWLTDEVEVGGGWKLRLAGFSDHRDWLTQFSSAAPVLLSITRLVFPLKPTTLTHYKQLPGLSEPSHLTLLIQFSEQLESFCFCPWVPLNCLTEMN